MSCSKALSVLSSVPPLPPKALERGGVVLGRTPAPCCGLPSPWLSLWALTPAPTPTRSQQMDHSFGGYSSSVRVASQHPGIPGASTPPSCSPGQDWTQVNSGARNTVGSAALPPPATPPFTAVGTEARRPRASPRSQPLPAGQGCLPDLASHGPRGAHALPSPC